MGLGSPLVKEGVSGALISSVARWALGSTGIVPRGLLYAAGGGAAVGGSLVRGETNQWANSVTTWVTIMRLFQDPHARGPIAGPTRSHQDKTSYSKV